MTTFFTTSPPEAAYARLSNGFRTMEELALLYKEKAAIEHDYATRLERLGLRHVGTEETETVRKALATLTSEYRGMGAAHRKEARDLEDQVIAPLERFIQQLKADFQLQQAQLKTRAQSRDSARDILISAVTLSRDPGPALQAYDHAQRAWTLHWVDAAVELEDLETQRVNYIKTNAWNVTNVTAATCVAVDRCCESVRVALERCDTQAAVSELRDETQATNQQQPVQMTRVPDIRPENSRVTFTSSTNRAPSVSSASSDESEPRSQPSTTSLHTAFSVLPKKDKTWNLPTRRRSRLQMQTAPPVAEPTNSMYDVPRATYANDTFNSSTMRNFDPEETGVADPLRAALEDLKIGGNGDFNALKERHNSIKLQKRKDSVKKVGRPKLMIEIAEMSRPQEKAERVVEHKKSLDMREMGRKSMQRDIPVAPNGLPLIASNGRPVLRHAKAVYEYRALIPEEVSFKRKDLMLVLGMQDDGWWEVEVLGGRGGVFGLAPSNYLVPA